MIILRFLNKIIANIVLFIVYLWQSFGPSYIRKQCRFTPSCSQYMKEAVQKHGGVKGLLLGIYRIIRCNPLCKGGDDPVR